MILKQTVNKLNDGWNLVELKELVDDPKKDIVDGPFGSNLKANEYIDAGVPVFKIQNIKANQFIDKNINYISEKKAKELSRHSFKSGDLIITKLGDPLGLCCKVPDKYPYGVIVADLIRFGLNSKKVLDKYLIYAINSIVIQNQFRAITKGTTRPRVNLTIVRSITLALAPLPEQRAIVSKIEQLFSDLDNGIDNFKKAQEQLKIYRQAVLKNACEGKLVPTEAELARAEGRDYEPADVLLARILEERREKWNGKGKYKEPAAPDTSGLPDLPEGWKWIKLGQITWSVRDGPHYSPEYVKEGIPFISGGNVRPDGVDFTNAKRITPELHSELSKRCKPEKGDILYTKGGTTGIARVNTYDFEFNVWVHVAILKLAEPVEPFYIQHALNSQYCYAQSQRFTHGVGNQDLGLTRMVNIILSLPPIDEQRRINIILSLPPIDEQRRIVVEVERRLSICDKLEETITESLEKAESLRQSILKKAFEGKLLNEKELEEARNALDWEPAEKLLERIKAEKTNTKRKNKGEK